MLQKFYWFNDTDFTQTLLKNTLSDRIGEVLPQRGLFFELEVPEGKHIFIKQWSYNHVLFSVVDVTINIV